MPGFLSKKLNLTLIQNTSECLFYQEEILSMCRCTSLINIQFLKLYNSLLLQLYILSLNLHRLLQTSKQTLISGLNSFENIRQNIKSMGSQISQSQQLRNTFPLSQYKILSEDKQFPQAVFLQRICDSSLFYACAVRTGQQGYEKSASKNVIKRVQRKQIGRTTYELYEWASANVQGLVQYINLIDKNRKISKSEYKAIVEGSVRGYNQISKQSFQIQCLQICMNKLRIFNEVSLKSVQNDSKQIVNSISVKIIPKNLNKSSSKPVQNGMKWENVGHCIHQGGVLTQKQLLGEYLLQLSNYATKSNSRQKRQRLNNLKNNFGTKMFQVIEALLSNREWKQVVKILDKPGTQAKQVDAHKVLNQIRNNIQTNGLKQKKTQTQKTIDTCDKNKSQKILFYCFKPQNNYQNEFKHQRNQNIENIFIENNKAKINNFQYQNLIQRNMINSNNQYKSVSPLKSQRYFSPPSIKVIKEAIPPKITNENSPQLAKNQPRYDETSNQFNDLNLTKTNSILTIYPDIFTDQMGTRNRIYSARNINPQLFSPEAKKPINFFGSPPKNQNQIKQSHNKSTHNIEQRKGKKIQFKPSKPNAILNVPIILEYQPKIKPDFIQGNKKQQIEFRQTGFPRNQTFISQQFDRLGFGLSDKYFGSENKKVVPNQSNLKKTHMQVAPKVQLKMDYLKVHSTVSNNNKYRNVNVKQVQSQTILIEPQINVHNMKNNQLQNKVPELKESKYVGPVNIKGQKEGYGQIIFPSGGSYVGNFYKDFMHGDGKLLYPSGRTAYEGTFKYDKFHGSGKLYNENPTYIQAFDFRNFNKIQVTQKEQPIHREHFLINGVQREKKISYWKYYEGQMNCDMKHGKGLMILQNGQKFEGQFKNDLVNGKGTFYGQNGRITGKWEDNLLIEIYR